MAPVQPLSSLVILRCPQCGLELPWGIADFPEIFQTPPPRFVRPFVVWSGRCCTAAQVARLRTVLPDLAKRSITDVVAAAGDRITFPLGVVRDWQAQNVIDAARNLNLDLRYHGIDDPAHD